MFTVIKDMGTVYTRSMNPDVRFSTGSRLGVAIAYTHAFRQKKDMDKSPNKWPRLIQWDANNKMCTKTNKQTNKQTNTQTNKLITNQYSNLEKKETHTFWLIPSFSILLP